MFTRHPFARPDVGLIAALSLGGFLDEVLGSARGTIRSGGPEVKETPDAYIVTIDMPGMTKDDVVITYKRDLITIRAEKGLAGQPDATEKTATDAAAATADAAQAGTKTASTERARSTFQQIFHTGVDLDIAAAKGKVEHGVLKLTLPKREVPKATRIEVL